MNQVYFCVYACFFLNILLLHPKQKLIIDKLAEFVFKKGKPFEETMKKKEANNPKFAFLFGGPENAYYKWKYYCTTYNVDSGKTAI